MARSESSLPDIGTIGSQALSIDQEKEYGWAFRLMANQSLAIIHDPVINNYVNSLGQNLVSNADSVKLPFNFFLVQDDEINAAAFLGGNIKINTGLFLYAKNESELASVLAHEIAHITQRHLARLLEQKSFNNPAAMATLAGSVLLSLVSPTAGIAALSTSIAVNVQTQINYTRSNESEADRIGMQTLVNAGYDPYGMANFFSKLAEKYQYASKKPELLSTHPLTATRITEARLRAGQLPKKKVKPSLNYQLSRARITVRFSSISTDAAIFRYQNEIKNNTDQIKDAAQYGLALAYFKNKDYLKANKLILALLNQSPDNLFYIDLLSDISIELHKTKPMITLLLQHYKKAPDNAVYAINLANILYIKKSYEKAENLLALFIRHHPSNIISHKLIINVYSKLGKKAKEHAAKAEYLALLGRFKKASQEMGNALAFTTSRLDQARYSAQIEVYKRDDLRLQALQKR